MLQASCGSDISHCSFAQNLIRTSLAVTSVRPLCRFSMLAKFTFQGLGFMTSALKKLIIHKFLKFYLCSNVTPYESWGSPHIAPKSALTYFTRHAANVRLGISVSGLACARKLFRSSRWLWSDVWPCVSARARRQRSPGSCCQHKLRKQLYCSYFYKQPLCAAKVNHAIITASCSSLRLQEWGESFICRINLSLRYLPSLIICFHLCRLVLWLYRLSLTS